MGLLDEVIVISDDEEPSPLRRSKRLKTGKSPGKSPDVLDITGDDDMLCGSNVDILGSADVIDIDNFCQAGPSTPARDKGKSMAMPHQQHALQAMHAAMQGDADGADRDALRQWLETAAATLPCNLPELMQHFRHSSPDGDGKGHRPVCRRDLLELLPLGIVHLVERSIYDAASRAVQHQRNPDGSVRQDPPSEPGVGVTPQAAGTEEVKPPAEQPSPASRGARDGRGGRRGKRAAPDAAEPDQGPACIPRGGPKGKRKAVQPEVGSAQQAKHVKHVLKRVGKEKVPSCPLCQSATTMACDKLEVMTLAELKLVMGCRGLSPGRSHRVCVDTLTASCQGLRHICPLCHGSITSAGDTVRSNDAMQGGEARWADRNVQHCLDLCTSVDLLHKLLIQEIQPVLDVADPTSGAAAAAGRGRGQDRGGWGGGRGSGPSAGPFVPNASAHNGQSHDDTNLFWSLPPMFQMGSSSSNGGWAKGTGYGGPGSYHGMPHQTDQAGQDSRKAAAERQQVVDEHLQRGITSICHCLQQATGENISELVQDCPPVWMTAVLYGGPFAASLRLLLQNGSVMEIGSKGRIYGELLRLLNVLGTNVDLVPLLYEPADFVAQPKDAAGSSTAPGARTPSVLDALHGLSQQCAVFKKSAEQLASGTTEDIGALSLALQIIDTSQELHQAAAQLKKLMPGTTAAPGNSTGQGAAAPGRPASGTRGAADRKKSKGRQAAPEDLQVLQTRYVETLRPESFTEHDLMDPQARFFFRDKAIASTSAGGEVMRKWLRRVSGEHATLSGSLPLAWSSSIFLAADPSRLDLLRALIIGPADTPYANGCFLFDIFLPPNYPTTPPLVQFLTTGGGRVRFNPNLYECGKVCLSLLGTWSGPSWDPAHSTLLQVLISIQSMILVDDPYFNEPGYESSRGSAQGKSANNAYNHQQQHNTLRHAILPALRHPDPCFAEVIKQHFRLKKGAIQQQMQEWQKIGGLPADQAISKPMKEAVTAVNTELDRM